VYDMQQIISMNWVDSYDSEQGLWAF
jgi:hypothetical protein